MKLLSPAFENGDAIPRKYGYNQENINPPLIIKDVPKDALSLVLIMDDPDAVEAVGKVWTHWILWNIPPTTNLFLENSVPFGSEIGMNDFGESGYGGPAPPDKEHTYYFKIYALTKTLNLEKDVTKEHLENLIKSDILSETTLIGKFSPS